MGKRRVCVNEQKSEKKNVQRAKSLKNKHRILDDQIASDAKGPYVDLVSLQVRKKHRLRYRDQLQACAPQFISA
jgi:hypothetical protein